MSEEEEVEDTSPAVWRWTKALGKGIYHIAYKAGEFLADLFGITTPRYYYVIREYERIMERRQAEAEAPNGGDGDYVPNAPEEVEDP